MDRAFCLVLDPGLCGTEVGQCIVMIIGDWLVSFIRFVHQSKTDPIPLTEKGYLRKKLSPVSSGIVKVVKVVFSQNSDKWAWSWSGSISEGRSSCWPPPPIPSHSRAPD